jgi:hypothetical protein
VAVAVAAPSPGLTRRPHRLLPALGGSPQVNAARPARQAEAPRNDNRGRKDDDALEAALGKLSLEAEAVVDAQAAGAEDEAHEGLNSCEWKEHMQYRHMVLHKRWRQEAPYAVTTARGHTGNVPPHRPTFLTHILLMSSCVCRVCRVRVSCVCVRVCVCACVS